MMSQIKDKKIIILHDYFLYKGGGERLIIAMAQELGADIGTAFIADDAFDPRKAGIKTYELYKESRFSKIPGFRYTQVNLAFLLKTRFLKDYDIVIHSGDTFNSLWNARGKINVAYMHTPPRHLYDSYEDRMRTYSLWKKLIFVPYSRFNRWRFEWLVRKLDKIIVNSKTVQQRVKQYLKLDSEIAYPCGDASDFRWLGQKDYYLSWARLYPAKRVPMIARAFAKMPDKKLVIASSGPDLDEIKEIAKGCENIDVRGWIEDDELIDLIGNCIATIYLPVREDFGMSPVESMRAGKPVLGVDEGGLKETIIHDETGLLLDPDFTEKDIIKAIENLGPGKATLMKEACQERAKLFTKRAFIATINRILAEQINSRN